MSKNPIKWVGYALDKLRPPYQSACLTYTENGAIKKVGAIEKVEIKTRGDKDPVHKSSYNPSDVADIVSLRITPLDKSRGTFTHHVYSDGTGTIKKGDTREFSTSSERR